MNEVDTMATTLKATPHTPSPPPPCQWLITWPSALIGSDLIPGPSQLLQRGLRLLAVTPTQDAQHSKPLL